MDRNLEAQSMTRVTATASQTAVGKGLRGDTAKLEALYDVAAEGICLLLGNRVLDCNRRMASIWGCSPEEIIGGTFVDLAAPDSAETIETYLRTGSDETIRFTAQKKDGTKFPVECTSRPVHLEEAPARVVSLLDLTALLRAEAGRAALEQRLKQAQGLLTVGQLAGGIAHDFNNLLSPIIGYAELMQEDLQPDDPMQHSVAMILEAAQRAADMSRQLLAFSRQQLLEAKVFDLNDVVRNLEPALRASLPGNIRLSITTTPDPLPVRGDAPQLEQALLNIAANSREAMPGGGDLLLETARSPFPASTRQSASSRPREANHALVTVRDTGCGIDAETLKHAFEPFFTTKEGGDASGLGLATVYGIVKQHQGQVSLDSRVGQGTVVHIYLPIAPPAQDPADGGEPEVKPVVERKKTIIVVEGDRMVRELARSVLEQLGYLVREFRSPDECLRAVEAESFRAELLFAEAEAEATGIGGAGLWDRLKATMPQLKALYLSASAAEAVATPGEGDPVVITVPKPFSVPVLSSSVRRLLSK